MGFSEVRGKISDFLKRREQVKALDSVVAELNTSPYRLDLLERQVEVCEGLEDPELLVSALRELGSAYVREALFARAIGVYKRILATDPDDPGVHAELASLIEQQRQGEPPPELDESQPFLTPERRAGAIRERASSALFALFESDALEEVLASTSLRTFPEGPIYREGEVGLAMFVVLEGEVRLTTESRGETIELAVYGAGELFGEVAVVKRVPRIGTAVAREKTTVIEVSRQRLEVIADHHPEVLEVLHRFCEERAEQAVELLVRRRPQAG